VAFEKVIHDMAYLVGGGTRSGVTHEPLLTSESDWPGSVPETGVPAIV
jgi:hypothetical protein